MNKGKEQCRVFGESVRKLRVSSGITQEELADLSGLDRSYIGGVERGDRNPTLVVIGKIAAGLSVPISSLFSSDAETKSGD